jgi:hypothetical protein
MRRLVRRPTIRIWLAVIALLGLIAAQARHLLPGPPLVDGQRLVIPAVMGSRTLVYFNRETPAPWPNGNCFELEVEPKNRPGVHGMHVINMHAENFEEANKRFGLESVEVEYVGGQLLVVDPRIPRRWLRSMPCQSCCGFGGTLLNKYSDRFGAPPPKP